MVVLKLETHSAAETEGVGAALASALGTGDVVFVEGELGTGKSTLVRGACRQLGVTEVVTSPTFVLGRRYEPDSRPAIGHVDLYRLDDVSLEDPALLADYFGPDTISFVEWPEQGARELGFGSACASIRLEHAGGDSRLIQVAAEDRLADVLERK